MSLLGAARRSLAVVLLAGLAGLSTTAEAWPLPAAVQPAAVPAPLELYDLRADEALGGHTLARHVGKSDDELAERLRREPQISAASTYTDLVTARRVVAAAVQQSRARIDAWARRSGARPNLVVNYLQPGGRSIGRSLARGARVSATCTRALVVLRWHSRQRRWYVLTSYPETAR